MPDRKSFHSSRTDVEDARLCAQSLPIPVIAASLNDPEHTLRWVGSGGNQSWWPFTNDKQLMMLIKAHQPDIEAPYHIDGWKVTLGDIWVRDDDLNRAVVQVIAEVQSRRPTK